MGIGVFLSLIFLGTAPAFAAVDILNDTLSLALGADAAKVEGTLLENQFTARGKHSPERKLRSGDVMIFLDKPKSENEKPADINLVREMPDAYNSGMQGFGHAALVAKDSKGIYRLESPADPDCRFEFRGKNSYVVVRPKEKVTGTPQIFQAAVDDLAASFLDLGYQYNPSFKTSVLGWPPEAKAAFRAELLRYRLSPEGEKPRVPDMYCSELPITVHSLLGVVPRQGITMSDLIDIGMAAELKNGKSKIQLVNETAEGMVNYFVGGYHDMIDGYQAALDKAIADKAPEQEVQAIRDDIVGLKETLQKIDALKGKLKKVLMVKLDIEPESAICQDEPHGVLDTITENLEKVLDKLKALPYQLVLNRQLIRPVDFLLDSLNPNGNYEIVGYYAGDVPALTETCK